MPTLILRPAATVWTRLLSFVLSLTVLLLAVAPALATSIQTDLWVYPRATRSTSPATDSAPSKTSRSSRPIPTGSRLTAGTVQADDVRQHLLHVRPDLRCPGHLRRRRHGPDLRGLTAATQFDPGNIKTQASAGELFTLTKTLYGTTNCTGAPVASYPQTVAGVNSSAGDTTATTATQSLKLEAAALANSTAPFTTWSSDGSFFSVLGASAICAPGFGSGSPHVYTANYQTDGAPTVTSTTPADGASGVAVNADIEVTFSENVVVNDASPAWLSISCTSSGTHGRTSSSGGANVWTYVPSGNFAASETCTATVQKGKRSDADTIDPPDGMDANYAFTPSTTGAGTVVLNVTASSPADGNYGDVCAVITPSYSGFTGGDTSANLTTAPTCSTNVHPGRGLRPWRLRHQLLGRGVILEVTSSYVAGISMLPRPRFR